MTAIELHPEVQLDRARHGQLAAGEREVLDAHVATCPACALHVGAPELFRLELGERDGDAALDLVVIDRAIAAIRAEGDQALSRRGRPGRWSVRLMMAALVLGGIAAGAYYAPRYRPPVSSTGQPAGIATPEETGPRTGPGRAETASQPEEVQQAASQPSATAPTHPRARPGGAKAAPSDGPEELFARANQLRRSGRDSESMALYRELQRAFPESREAKLSQATLARLLLEHGQASEALSGFDSYLKSGDTGVMTEDALVGRAMALMKLNQRDQERATWQNLLARFPNSIHASRARARLGELR
jgi:TolA-binding protein